MKEADFSKMFQSRCEELDDFLKVSYCPLTTGQIMTVREFLRSMMWFVGFCCKTLNPNR